MEDQRKLTKLNNINSMVERLLIENYTLANYDHATEKLVRFVETNIKTHDEINCFVSSISKIDYRYSLQKRLACRALQLLSKFDLKDHVGRVEVLLLGFLGKADDLCDSEYASDLSLTFNILKGQFGDESSELMAQLGRIRAQAMESREFNQAKTVFRIINYLNQQKSAPINQRAEDIIRDTLSSKIGEECDGDVQLYEELLQLSYEADLGGKLGPNEVENLFQVIVNNLKNPNIATQENAVKCLRKYFDMFRDAQFIEQLEQLGNERCDAFLESAGARAGKTEDMVEETLEASHDSGSVNVLNDSETAAGGAGGPPQSSIADRRSEGSEGTAASQWPYATLDDLVIYHIPKEKARPAWDESAWYVQLRPGSTSVQELGCRREIYAIRDRDATGAPAASAPVANGVPSPISRKSARVAAKRRRFNPLLPKKALSAPLNADLRRLTRAEEICLLRQLLSRDPGYATLDYIGRDRLNDIVSRLASLGYIDQMRPYIADAMRHCRFTREEADLIIVGVRRLQPCHPLHGWGLRLVEELRPE